MQQAVTNQQAISALVWVCQGLFAIVLAGAGWVFTREIKSLHKRQTESNEIHEKALASAVNTMKEVLEFHSKGVAVRLEGHSTEIHKLRTRYHDMANLLTSHQALLERMDASQERTNQVLEKVASAVTDLRVAIAPLVGDSKS